MGGNARLWYPSVLYLSRYSWAEQPDRPRALLIEDRSQVAGTVIVSDVGSASLQSNVFLRGRTRLDGVLYARCGVTLYARFTGSAYVNSLIYRQPGSVYNGWLRESSLTHADLSAMVVPPVFPGQSEPTYLTIVPGEGS